MQKLVVRARVKSVDSLLLSQSESVDEDEKCDDARSKPS